MFRVPVKNRRGAVLVYANSGPGEGNGEIELCQRNRTETIYVPIEECDELIQRIKEAKRLVSQYKSRETEEQNGDSNSG